MQKKIITKISNNNCDLFFFNKFKRFIKTPERIFFLSAHKNCERGDHAHKICSQFLFPIKGNIKISIDNGKNKKETLIKLGTIIKIKPMNWIKVKLKKDQILAVICDKPYSKNEYIRSYQKFKKLVS